MPTPIQSSSITKKLRSFFRLRGRQIFTLDETAVPVVSVEDLTSAPYRGNHQIRWKVGESFVTDTIAARNFMIAINLSQAAVMDLSDVPGVAVVEEVELIPTNNQAPTGARDWIISLISHQGFLNSVEPGAVVTRIATDVDAARNTGAGAGAVEGQVPVRLNGVQENVAPALGTLLRLGRMRVGVDQDPVAVYRAMSCEQVTIGDNVALFIRNVTAATAGVMTVNVSGTYYPLARS